jgi:hypothetical protein
MPSYDASRFDPPAPVAEVKLLSPEAGKSVSGVLLLVDTGADVTLLPRAAAEALGISPPVGQLYELIAFDGPTSFAPAVALDMVFLNRVFRGRYLLIEQDHGILGRDVLNHAALLLDGPRQQWTEHSPS